LSDKLQPEKKQAESENETAQRGHGREFRDAGGRLQASFPPVWSTAKCREESSEGKWKNFEKPLAADGLAG
jgi:hypothetical protein